MKNIFTLLLAAAMLTGTMAACGNTVEETETLSSDTTAAETETDDSWRETSDELGDITFSGRAYNVLYRDEDEHLREITAEELTGEIINDAIYNRSEEIMERFDITIGLVPVAEGNLNKSFSNSVTAGDRDFDIAFQHMIFTSSLAAGGVTLNWYDIPHLNFDKPWWTSSVDELTVNGIMYVTASDYCLNTFEMAWCLIFNKQMMADMGITTTPYDLVAENNWTMDTYYGMVKDVSYDSNGDGSMTVDDIYGINSYGHPWLASISNYWWACGETISRFDDNGMPYFAMESEKTQLVFEKMYALLVENNISYWDQTAGKDMIFWHDQALFASMMLRDVEVNRDKDLSYGLVPYPKYDQAQEKYLSLVDGHASMMALPVTLTAEDQDFVGAMVEAFSAATYNSVLPAYYETAMQTKFAQDETMPEMLTLVREGRVFNFGYLYDITTNRDILVNLITGKKTDLASKIASVKEKTQNYYDEVTHIYEK